MRQRTFRAAHGQGLDDLLQVVASSVEYRKSRTRLLLAFEPVVTSIESLETLFSGVDEAMYEAKHSGRNCVRVR